MISPREAKRLMEDLRNKLDDNTKTLQLNLNCNEDILNEQKNTNKLLIAIGKAFEYLNRGIDIIGAAISPENYGGKPLADQQPPPEPEPEPDAEPETPTAQPPLTEPEEPPSELPEEPPVVASGEEIDKEKIRKELEEGVEGTDHKE